MTGLGCLPVLQRGVRVSFRRPVDHEWTEAAATQRPHTYGCPPFQESSRRCAGSSLPCSKIGWVFRARCRGLWEGLRCQTVKLLKPRLSKRRSTRTHAKACQLWTFASPEPRVAECSGQRQRPHDSLCDEIDRRAPQNDIEQWTKMNRDNASEETTQPIPRLERPARARRSVDYCWPQDQ